MGARRRGGFKVITNEWNMFLGGAIFGTGVTALMYLYLKIKLFSSEIISEKDNLGYNLVLGHKRQLKTWEKENKKNIIKINKSNLEYYFNNNEKYLFKFIQSDLNCLRGYRFKSVVLLSPINSNNYTDVVAPSLLK